MRYSRDIFQNATMPLIGVNIILFILQYIINGFTETFMLISQDVLSRPWILITSMFLHADPMHLILNMYVLLMFGSLIEQKIGTKRFLIVYFVSGFLASLLSTPFYRAALGASGAIMGILGVTIVLLPHLKVLLFFVIPMSLRTAGILFVIIELLGALGIGIPGIANVAHLVGLFCGLGFGFYLLKKRKGFTRRFTEKPKVKVIHPEAHTKSIEMSKEEIDDYLRHGRL
jgi:membrane associated rhomboid family serine protease